MISFASRAWPWRTYATGVALVLMLGGAALMRVQFFRSFPDPFASPDTWSYLTGTYSLLQEGRFELISVRTPVLSVLVYALLQTFGSYAAVTIFQGALTLASCVAIFATVRSFGGPWRLAGLGAVALLGFNAHLFFWEHYLHTEACYSALLVGTLCSTASTIRAPTRWRAALAGLFAALTVLTRPQGVFVVPLVIAAVAWGGRGLGRRHVLRLSGAALVAPVLLIGGWSIRNAVVHGFFGLTDMGPSQMFGVTARWVDLERPTFLEAKGVIRPYIERYRHMSDDVDWVQYAADGPRAALEKHYQGDRKRVNADLAGLAREVIIYHPIPFIRRGLETTMKTLRSTPNYSSCNYACKKTEDRFWEELNRYFPVDQHRASLNTARYPPKVRAAIFNRRVRPVFARETFFIRLSLAAVMLTFLLLPALDPQCRLVAGLAAIAAVLQVFTAGFFSDPAERYLALLHGPAALGFGLAVPGFAAYLATLVLRKGKRPAG